VGCRGRKAGRQRRLPLALLRGCEKALTREDVIKPTPEELGIDPAALAWERSGDDDGSIEVAFPLSQWWARGDWVLVRVAGDEAGRVLVFDRNEWECFIDGARNGEFDDVAGPSRLMS
jgi:Domain of unknown function (DUF397)